MSRRFYSEKPIHGEQSVIMGDEAKHITGVNRLGVGDDIVLFDGSGTEFDATISEAGKNKVVVAIVSSRNVSQELTANLTLAVALPKGDRQKVLVEKLVELGVTTLIPVNCTRSVAIANEKNIQRLERRVIEASKQCGRNVLMQIKSPVSFETLVQPNSEWNAVLIAHPYGETRNAATVATELDSQDSVIVFIGPEGGFTDKEVALAAANGWQPVSLSRIILRVETAAVAAATLFGIGRLTA